jgi:hypothetical protein
LSGSDSQGKVLYLSLELAIPILITARPGPTKLSISYRTLAPVEFGFTKFSNFSTPNFVSRLVVRLPLLPKVLRLSLLPSGEKSHMPSVWAGW